MRQAAEENGGNCVFTSEIDNHAAGAYFNNYNDMPNGDITKIDENQIPNHDVIFAGFPCQPFSISGFKKGFVDTRGTLFYDIIRIAKYHKTPVLILENVKHFFSHDNGNTLSIIRMALENLGYSISIRVINAANFGLPQNRERTIIVASLREVFNFDFIKTKKRQTISQILETDISFEYLNPADYTLLSDEKIKTQAKSGLRFSGYLNRNLRKVGVRDNTEHLSRVHKQPNRIYCASGTHPTLSAGESSGRYWILTDGNVRKLTMRECYRLQGFKDSFKISQTPSAAYKQIGNSVPIPMISEIIRSSLDQGVIKSPSQSQIAA